MTGIGYRLAAFARLSRLPFLVPGLAPFTAGVLLGWADEGSLNPSGLLFLGYIGLMLIMLSTYYSNEYFDYEGDVMNRDHNRFSGGSRALSDDFLPRRIGIRALAYSLTLFIVLSFVYASLYYVTRPLLAPMAAVGLLFGVFYSAPPLRWAYRGVGEPMILFAYGWLAVSSGYYIVTGSIGLMATLLSFPAAFTVFSVIVINEFPDYHADAAIGKKNLVVRLGKERASLLYAGSNAAAAFSSALAGYLLGGFTGLTISALSLGLPSLWLATSVLRGVHRDPVELERICAATALLNAVAAFPPLIGLLW